jgi:hypothetical protein
MLPVFCNGCHKAVAMTMDGLHPFITEVSRCSVYNDTSWIERRGCAFNATFDRRTKAKVNPLKASKRGGR